MLAEQRVNQQRGARVAGGIDSADLHADLVAGGINLTRIHVRDGEEFGARHGKARDAPTKAAQAASRVVNLALAEEIDIGHDVLGAAHIERERTHGGDDPARAHAHLDLAADLPRHRHAGVRMAAHRLHAGNVHHRAGRAAADPGDEAERRLGGIATLGDDGRPLRRPISGALPPRQCLGEVVGGRRLALARAELAAEIADVVHWPLCSRWSARKLGHKR